MKLGIPLVPLVVLFGVGMLLIMWGGILVIDAQRNSPAPRSGDTPMTTVSDTTISNTPIRATATARSPSR